MRRIIAAIAALAITLALFYLMQLMISGDGRHLPKPNNQGGIGLVTLLRDVSNGGESGPQRRVLPPTPIAAPVAPAPPRPRAAENVAPAKPDLAMDMPVPEAPVVEALPYLGGPPVVAAKKVAPPVKPKVAKKKSSKKSSKKSKSRSSTAKAHTGQSSARNSKRTGSGKSTSGAGGSRGKSRGGKRSPGARSTGNSGVVVLSRPKPAYPRKAVKSGKEGWVKVSFTITEQGTVKNPVVVAAKPRRIFDHSALQAIRKWRFKPKTVGGRPVRTKATQLIEFKLAKR